ncbi:MAG TPA: hypothetical protein VIQ30_00265 [Pseudonocardia sp.]
MWQRARDIFLPRTTTPKAKSPTRRPRSRKSKSSGVRWYHVAGVVLGILVATPVMSDNDPAAAASFTGNGSTVCQEVAP